MGPSTAVSRTSATAPSKRFAEELSIRSVESITTSPVASETATVSSFVSKPMWR